MSDMEFFKVSVEDIDGDLIEIDGDARDALVTVTLNSEVEDVAWEARVTIDNARVVAAAFQMAANAAEGRGIGL